MDKGIEFGPGRNKKRDELKKRLAALKKQQAERVQAADELIEEQQQEEAPPPAPVAAEEVEIDWDKLFQEETTLEPEPVVAPTPPPAPAPTPVPSLGAPPAVNVDEVAAETNRQVDAYIEEKTGLSAGPDYYASGSQAGGRTTEGYEAKRAEFMAMPDALEECGVTLPRMIAAEDRQDIEVEGFLLSMADGKLITPDGSFGLEERAVQQLFSREVLGASFGRGAMTLGQQSRIPELDALFNRSIVGFERYRLDGAADELRANVELDEKELARKLEDLEVFRPLKLRTRLSATGQRDVYSVVTPSYTALDVDEIMKILASILALSPKAEGARASIKYDGHVLRSKVLWFHETICPCTGDTFQVGLELVAADDKSRGIHGNIVFYRNRCLNYIIIGEKRAKLGVLRHTGDRKQLKLDVLEIFAKAIDFVGGLMEVWAERSKEEILSSKRKPAEPKDVIKALVATKAVRLPGLRADQAEEALMKAYQVEPGYTRTAYINMITRAAHQVRFGNFWAAEQIEEQAGELLYVRTFYTPVA